MPRTLLICHSTHHGNTWKVARAMADELDATVVQPEQFRPEMLPEYDLVGFGSGIYVAGFHRDILELVTDLPEQDGKKAFVFSTAGSCCQAYHLSIMTLLGVKGFEILGEFTCPGCDTYRFPGSEVNSGHPDEDDLARARAFVRSLAEKSGSEPAEVEPAESQAVSS